MLEVIRTIDDTSLSKYIKTPTIRSLDADVDTMIDTRESPRERFLSQL